MVVHFNRLKPCPSSVTEVTHQGGAERQPAAGIPPEATNQGDAERPLAAGIPPGETWLQTLAPTVGRESEGVVPGARPGGSPVPPTAGESSVPGRCAAPVGSQGPGNRPARDTQDRGQESSDPGPRQTATTSRSPMAGERQQDAALSQPFLTLFSRQGRQRRAPGWSRDYELS